MKFKNVLACLPPCCDFTFNWFSVQLDEVMGTANAVAGRVGEQSRIFENIGNKVLAVGAKFPAINGIINAVRRKKSKVSNALHTLSNKDKLVPAEFSMSCFWCMPCHAAVIKIASIGTQQIKGCVVFEAHAFASWSHTVVQTTDRLTSCLHASSSAKLNDLRKHIGHPET